MAGATDLLGQLWKEYALSDSRYMTSDPLVLCMEAWTVVCVSILLHCCNNHLSIHVFVSKSSCISTIYLTN